MEPFEVTIDDEVFHISGRRQPGGALSYDIAWLDGPVEGPSGFTIGRFVAGTDDHDSPAATPMTEDALLEEIRSFMESVRATQEEPDEDVPGAG